MSNEDLSGLGSTSIETETEETVANLQDAAGRAPLVIRADAIRIQPDANGVVTLPAEVALGDIAVVGTDLVIELPDGTQWVIVDGAIFVPQLVIGDVEVPPTNLAALLIGEEPEPAAGQNQSSGGNFAVAVPDLGPPHGIGDLLPPTALDYQPPEPRLLGQYLEPDNEPDIVIETPDNPTGAVNATAVVSESGLPAGPGLGRDAGESEGSAASGDGESVEGTFVYFSPDTPNVLAVDGLVVNGTVITGPGQIIEGEYGFLEILAVRDGEIDFRYTLTDNTNGDDTSDDFSVTVTDADGDTATATLSVAIIDDVPVARDDADLIASGGMVAEGNVITGEGTTTGNAGADTKGADGASLVEATGFGATEHTDNGIMVQGQYGVLNIHADGTYTYVRTSSAPGDHQDVFEYTLRDGDGDLSTATLTISIEDAGVTITINPDPDTDTPFDTGGRIVEESGLPPRGDEPAGSGESADGNPNNDSDQGEQATGTITWTDGDGTNTVCIEGVDVTGAGQVIPVEGGTLTIISYDPDANVIEYRYTLADNTSGDDTSISFEVCIVDEDGDMATDRITIDIVDDVPVARDDTDYIAPGGMAAAGNVMTAEGTTSAPGGADTEGADGASLVDASGFGDTTEVDGHFVVQGQYGVLTIYADGSYTYARDPNSPGGVEDVFDYTIEDGDGDQSSATLTIVIDDLGDSINITPDPDGGTVVDEGGLPPRDGETPGTGEVADGNPNNNSDTSETVTGTITWNDGDGVNVVRINDTIVTGPGQQIPVEGGILTIISYDPDANVIEYSYTLTDNTSGDTTSISFEVSVTDADGDVGTDTVTITIEDDAPIANDDFKAGVENQPVTVDVFDNDTPGADGVALDTIVYVDGTLSGSGTLVNNGDGTFTYTPSAGEEGLVTFDYQITDGDGDIATATVTIDLGDDSTPRMSTPDALLVDEDGLANANVDANPLQGNPGETDSTESATDSGTVTVSFGNDVPANLMGSFVFTNPGALDGQLTSGGVPVTFALVGGELVGSAGGSEVIRIALSGASQSGSDVTYTYDVTLSAPVDQADVGNTENSIDLSGIAFRVTDSDGDFVDGSTSVAIVDDVPSAGEAVVNQANENAPVSIVIDGALVEGADGVDLGEVTWSVSSGNAAHLAYDDNGTFTYTPSAGEEGVVQFSYTIVDGDGDEITRTVEFTLTDSAPRIGDAESLAADEDSLAGFNDDEGQVLPDPVEVAHSSNLSGDVTVTYGGDVPADLMDAFAFAASNEATLDALGWTSGGAALSWTVSADGHTLTGSAGGSAVVVVTLDSASVTNAATGEVTYSYSLDLLGVLDHMDAHLEDTLSFDIAFDVTDLDNDGASSSIAVSIHDDVLSAGEADVSQADENADVIVDITVDLEEGADGVDLADVTYSVSSGNAANLSYDDNGTFTYDPSAGETGTVEFTYSIYDGDGDVITRTVSFDLTDSSPTFSTPTALSADEDSLAGFNDDEGQVAPDPVEVNHVEALSGSVVVTFGGDVPANLMDAFEFLQSNEATLDALGWTAGGDPITWDVSADGHTVVGSAGGMPVVEITLDSAVLTNAGTGAVTYSYSINLMAPIDHMDAHLEDTLGFDLAFDVTDFDGDGLPGNPAVHVSIHDDVLSAGEADVSQAGENADVIVDITVDLEEGADGVDLADVTYSVSSGNAANLSYDDNGTFTYDPSAGETGTIEFTYSIYDGDGDVITRTVSFDLKDSAPQSGDAEAISADEDSLGGYNDDEGQGAPDPVEVDHVENLSGTVAITYGEDLPGNLMNAFEFLQSNEATLDALGWSSEGDALTWDVSVDGHTLTGSAGGSAVVIVTLDSAVLTDAATGEVTYGYSIELLAPVDHGDAHLEDTLSFSIAYDVTDVDGDHLAGTPTISVSIYDDVQSVGTADVTQADENANVVIDITTDLEEGADGVDLGDVTYDVNSGTPANWSYDGNGTFTYDPAPGETGLISLTYRIFDGDGDVIERTVEYTLTDTTPELVSVADAIVDEDGLGDEVGEPDANTDIGQTDPLEQVGTGSDTSVDNAIVVDFGADLPGNPLTAFSFVNVASLDGQLTQGGDDIEFAAVGNVLTGRVNGVGDAVITITVSVASVVDGEVTYHYDVDLDGPVDQLYGDDSEAITVDGLLTNVQFQVTDFDGTQLPAPGSFNVGIWDDVPQVSFTNDDNTVDTLTTSDAGLPNSDDTLYVGDLLTYSAQYGADGMGTADDVTYGVAISSSYVAADGTDMFSGGDEIYLYTDGTTVWGATSATYVASDSTEVVFTVAVDEDSGQVTLTQKAPIDHPIGTDPLPLADGLIEATLSVTITDGDGDQVTDDSSVDLGGNLLFADDTPTMTPSAFNGTVILDETTEGQPDPDGVNGSPGDAQDTANLSVNFTPNFGADVPGDVTYGLSLTGSNVASGLYALDNSVSGGKGAQIVLNQSGSTVTGTAGIGGPIVFSIVMNIDTGVITFTQFANLWHGDTGTDDDAAVLDLALGVLEATAYATDYDGDVSLVAKVDLGDEVFQIEDDGVTIGTLEASLMLDNTLPIVETGDFVFDVGTDGASADADGTLGITDVTLNSVLINGSPLAVSDFSISYDVGNTWAFEFTYDTGLGTSATGHGNLVFDGTEWQFTLDEAISGFSVTGTAATQPGDILKYALNSNTPTNSTSPVTVAQVDDEFFIQFSGQHSTGGNTPTIVSTTSGDQSLSGGTSVNFSGLDLFTAAQTTVTVSSSTIGVAGNTIQAGEILDFNFYALSPTGTLGGEPTASSDILYFVVDGIGATEEFLVVLKLYDADLDIYTTRTLAIENGDMFTNITSGPGQYSGIDLDNNDGLVIIESYDYNINPGDNWTIVGAQVVSTGEGITGTAIDFNRAIATYNPDGTLLDAGNSTDTQAFSTITDTAPFKFQDLGVQTIDTNNQSAEFDFTVEITDGDGDSETVDLDVTVGTPPSSAMVEKIALNTVAANDDFLLLDANESRSLAMSSAVALGLAGTMVASKFQWFDGLEQAGHDVDVSVAHAAVAAKSAIGGTETSVGIDAVATTIDADTAMVADTALSAREAIDLSLDFVDVAPTDKGGDAQVAQAETVAKEAIVDFGDVALPGGEALAALAEAKPGIDLAMLGKEALVGQDDAVVDAVLAKFAGADAVAEDGVAHLAVVGQEALGMDAGSALGLHADFLLTDAMTMHQDATLAVVNG